VDRSTEDLERGDEDRHGDQRDGGQVEIQPGHHHGHEHEGPGGTDEDQHSLLEQGLERDGIGARAEDDVAGLGPVVIAQREPLEPAKDIVTDPPQATQAYPDRDVDVAGIDGGVRELEYQGSPDDRGDLGGKRPVSEVAREPGRVRLAAQDAVDQDCQRPGLEQIDRDTGQQQPDGEADASGVGPEVTEGPGHHAEAGDGGRGQVAYPPGRFHRATR